ncbi:MAG: 50S ribosomal protein L9 [Actinomycetes bacterium]
MKVILKQEVDNVGLAGDIVDVKDGFGRNYLIPRGLAILATKGAVKEAEALTRARLAREASTLGDAQAAKDSLESRTLRIEARVDDRGNLYGSVSAVDVQRVLKERGFDVERKRIDLKQGIKVIGTYEVPVQVHPQVVAAVQVEVVDEEGVVLRAGGNIEPAVDEEAVVDAAADAAEGSETDVDVLAEQALEAAKEFEAERLAAEAEAGDTDTGADADTEEPVEA